MSMPYFLMVVLYFSMALLVMLDASFTSLNLLQWFNGLRWLRVHFITLGILTEAVFGILPSLAALRAQAPRPKMRWDIWFCLNAGLLTLLIGIPLVNQVLILMGGTLIFIAASLLLKQLINMRPRLPTVRMQGGGPFYLAGLSYLLLGIIIGTGLWLGWGQILQIAIPIEVHIHANNWGFMSLVFAGLLIDLYPGFAGTSVAWPRSIRPIFWLMTLGALGLVIGPWVSSQWFSAPGLILHLSATIWLLLNISVPLYREHRFWKPGPLHLVTSYLWIILPVLVAPLILLGVPGFASAGIEQNAPQALIYGWVLQFGYALLPYLFTRLFLPESPAKLGGNWFSLLTAHIGGVLLWASIFIVDYQTPLQGIAYGFWFISAAPILLDIWRIIRAGLSNIENEKLSQSDLQTPVASGD